METWKRVGFVVRLPFLLHCNVSFIFVITAYRHESTAYNSTLDYFSIKDDSTAWIIPVLVRVSNDLRILATMVRSPPTLNFSIVWHVLQCSVELLGG